MHSLIKGHATISSSGAVQYCSGEGLVLLYTPRVYAGMNHMLPAGPTLLHWYLQNSRQTREYPGQQVGDETWR